MHRLVANGTHDVAGPQALLGRITVGIDIGDEHAVHIVVEIELAARVRRQRRQAEAHCLRLDVGLAGAAALLRGCDLLILALGDVGGDVLAAAIAHYGEGGLGTGKQRGHATREIARILHRFSVDRDHDIALLQACFRGGAASHNFGDDRPLHFLRTKACGHLRRDRLDLHAKPAAADMAMGLQLGHHIVNRGSRNREPDADAAAGRRIDHGIHADDLPAQVKCRPAGIAAIDGRVDLDEVRIGPIANITTDRRNDAGRHRIGKTERIADGDNPIAHAQLAIVAKFDCGKRLVAFHLDQRHIGCGIGANQLRIELTAIGQFHGDLRGMIDDMIVGDDVARLVDDEARADANGFLRCRVLAAIVAEELAERFGYVVGKLAHRRGRFGLGFDGDADDGGAHALHQIGEAEGRTVLEHARGLNMRLGGHIGREGFRRMWDRRGGLMIGGQRKCAKAHHDNDSRRRRSEQARMTLLLVRGGLGVLHENLLLEVNGTVTPMLSPLPGASIYRHHIACFYLEYYLLVMLVLRQSGLPRFGALSGPNNHRGSNSTPKQKDGCRAKPKEPGAGLQRRPHQDEIAITPDKIILDPGIAVTGFNPFADQPANVGSDGRIGLVNGFALADDAAQFLLQSPRARFHRRIGQRPWCRRCVRGAREKNECESQPFHSAATACAFGCLLLARTRPHRLARPPSAMIPPPNQMKGASGL